MSSLAEDEFYMDEGKFVLTERYHLRRGLCCGNGCRHCPFGHENVPERTRRSLPRPWNFFSDSPELLP